MGGAGRDGSFSPHKLVPPSPLCIPAALCADDSGLGAQRFLVSWPPHITSSLGGCCLAPRRAVALRVVCACMGVHVVPSFPRSCVAAAEFGGASSHPTFRGPGARTGGVTRVTK